MNEKNDDFFKVTQEEVDEKFRLFYISKKAKITEKISEVMIETENLDVKLKSNEQKVKQIEKLDSIFGRMDEIWKSLINFKAENGVSFNKTCSLLESENSEDSDSEDEESPLVTALTDGSNPQIQGMMKQIQSIRQKCQPKLNDILSDIVELNEKQKVLQQKLREEIDHELYKQEEIVDFQHTCVICFSSYDSGKHKQSCLKNCGHMFGRPCIEKYLENGNRCPKCNKEFQNEDIITLF